MTRGNIFFLYIQLFLKIIKIKEGENECMAGGIRFRGLPYTWGPNFVHNNTRDMVQSENPTFLYLIETFQTSIEHKDYLSTEECFKGVLRAELSCVQRAPTELTLPLKKRQVKCRAGGRKVGVWATSPNSTTLVVWYSHKSNPFQICQWNFLNSLRPKWGCWPSMKTTFGFAMSESFNGTVFMNN